MASPRNSAPITIATGGTSRVTSKALVAPAEIDQPEVEDVGVGAAYDGQDKDRSDRAERRERLLPRLVEDQCNWKHHERARGQLAGGDRHRRNPLPLEPARPNSGQGIEEGGGYAGKLRQHVIADRAEQIGADHQSDTAKSEQNACDFARGHALVGGENVGDDDAPDRGGRVEDRREPARNVRLAPAEQDEGDHIVQQREEEHRAPDRAG